MNPVCEAFGSNEVIGLPGTGAEIDRPKGELAFPGPLHSIPHYLGAYAPKPALGCNTSVLSISTVDNRILADDQAFAVSTNAAAAAGLGPASSEGSLFACVRMRLRHWVCA